MSHGHDRTTIHSSMIWIMFIISIHNSLIVVTILFTEDHSKPKFANSEWKRVKRQIDPVTLNMKRTDETTMKAVQLFASQVVLILHTCNVNEYLAALEKLEPPTKEDQSKIRDRAIIHPQFGSVIGWFAGYRAAVVRTGQGDKCRDELMKALTESFPNSQVIIGTGIAYANNRKCKLADVLISDQVVQYEIVGGEIIRGEDIDPDVKRVFEDPLWYWNDTFVCADNDRASVAHVGCIVSTPRLDEDELLQDQLMNHTPHAIGGEMEGWILLQLKKELKQNKDFKVIIIKGVADYGDLSKGDEWQWTAAKAAIDCIHCCLEKSAGIEFNGKENFPIKIRYMTVCK